MRVTVVGGGAVAMALIGGLLAGGRGASELALVESDAGRRECLRVRHGIRAYPEPHAEALCSDVVFLAVDPELARAACASLAGRLDGQLLVSLVEGLRLADLSRWLDGYGRLVRAAPNVGVSVGAGMTGLYADARVAGPDRQRVECLLRTVGETHWVANELQIDALTAIAATGSAYFYMVLESMQQLAVEVGLSAEQAGPLSLHAVLGTTRLASVVRDEAVPRGVFDVPGLAWDESTMNREMQERTRGAIVAGVFAARARSCELGEAYGSDRASAAR